MPGYTRYWTPFTGTNNAEIVNAQYKYSQKANCRVLINLTPLSLAFMDSAETLLINGHGRAGSLVMSESRDGSGRRISVHALAQTLIHAGLPRNHVRIKLLGCETADMARFLAIELGRTHPNIVVGGYIYSIYIGPGQRTLVSTPSLYWPVLNTTNSGNVRWYDANGNNVVKPNLMLPGMPYDPYLDPE